jgi:hypothetical protein
VAPLSVEQVLQVLAGQRSVPDLPRIGPRMAWRMAYRSDVLVRVLAEADLRTKPAGAVEWPGALLADGQDGIGRDGVHVVPLIRVIWPDPSGAGPSIKP